MATVFACNPPSPPIRRSLSAPLPSKKSVEASEPKDSKPVIDALSSQKSFADKSSSAMGALRESSPQLFTRLNALKAKYPRQLEALKKEGWQGMKTVCDMTQPGEEGISYESLRQEVVSAVQELGLEVLKEFGFENPGQYSATGTPGWNSDIDTVFLASEGVPVFMQMTEKLLFDMIFQDTFGELPGFLFDTESYLNHAGSVLGTENQMRTPEGRAAFTRLEFSAAALQMLQQCGGPDSAGWKSFTEKHLHYAADNPPLQAAMQSIFDDVTEFRRHVDTQIERQALREHGYEEQTLSDSEVHSLCQEIIRSNPDALQRAKMSYKTGPLLAIAQEIDHLKGSQGGFSEAEQDMRQLKIASLYLLREPFFDEGYYGQGTFAKTCSNLNGQMHQRKIDDFRSTLSYASTYQLNINELIAQGRGFQYDRTKAGRTSPTQNACSTFENLAMYHGHFEHKVREKVGESGDLKSTQKALVATSKYSERLMSSAYELISNLPEEKKMAAQEHLQKAREILEKTRELEKVKRETHLSSSAARKIIKEKLSSSDPDAFERAFIECESSLEAMRYEESLTPEDFYFQMLDKLNFSGFEEFQLAEETDQKGLLVTRDPHFSDVLKARCGVQVKDPVETERLSGIRRLSFSHTIEELGFDSSEDISDFNDDVRDLATQSVYLSMSHGLLLPPIITDPRFLEAVTLWKEWKQHDSPRLLKVEA